MKKFVALLSLIILLFLPSTISAAEVPIRDAWILSEQCVVALTGNGNLLIAKSIDDEKPTLLASDVSDFTATQILHKNGDITPLEVSDDILGTITGITPLPKIKANAAKIYNDYYFIDADNNLKYYHSYNDEILNVMDGVSRLYDSTYRDNKYVISTSGDLFKISRSGLKFNYEQPIMSDVFYLESYYSDLYIVTRNGDLYYYTESSFGERHIPERIGRNVRLVFPFNGGANFITSPRQNENGKWENAYSFHTSGTLYTYPAPILDRLVYDDNHQYGVFSNDLTDFGRDYMPPVEEKTVSIGNSSYLYFVDGAGIDFIKDGDDTLYLCKNKSTLKYEEYMTEVSWVENYKNKVYLFRKNNGELWAAFEGSYTDNKRVKEPFKTAFCEKPTKVIINGEKISLTSKIQFLNNRSMYPFRECLEEMGATVMWDEYNKIAIGKYNGITIEFPIGKSEYYINGEKYSMDTAAYIDTALGRTYIPIRYAAEGLGFSVDWVEGETEDTISIYK